MQAEKYRRYWREEKLLWYSLACLFLAVFPLKKKKIMLMHEFLTLQLYDYVYGFFVVQIYC